MDSMEKESLLNDINDILKIIEYNIQELKGSKNEYYAKYVYKIEKSFYEVEHGIILLESYLKMLKDIQLNCMQ